MKRVFDEALKFIMICGTYLYLCVVFKSESALFVSHSLGHRCVFIDSLHGQISSLLIFP